MTTKLRKLHNRGRLIDSRTHWSYDRGYYRNDHYREYQLGDIVTFEVAAPGTGRRNYRVTRVDDVGAWGVAV